MKVLEAEESRWGADHALADFWPFIRNRESVLNAGVDINGFEPVTIEELIENNRKFKEDQV